MTAITGRREPRHDDPHPSPPMHPLDMPPPPPAPLPAAAVATPGERYDQFLTALTPAVIAAAREVARARAVIYPAHLCQHPLVVAALVAHRSPASTRPRAHLKAGRKLIAIGLARAEAQGAIQRLGRKLGYRVPGVERTVVTLASVFAYAKEHASATVAAKMQTSAHLIAEGLRGAKAATDRVGVGDLLWDTTHERWAILPDVARWSRELRQAPPATTADHLLYAARLLDIGAAGGLLTKGSARHPLQEWDAGDLTPMVEEFTAALVTNVKMPASNARSLRSGLRVLGAYAARQSVTAASQVDWNQVRRAVEADRYTPTLPEAAYNSARWAFNRLRTGGHITADAWGRERVREGLVGHAAVEAAALRGDWSGWVDGKGRPYLALLGPGDAAAPGDAAPTDPGPTVPILALRAFVTWMDARLSADALAQRGYPPRQRYKPTASEQTREIRKRRGGHPDFARQPNSLRGALTRLNHFLGWAARDRAIDWRTTTLDAVLTEELLRAYALDYREHHRGADAGDAWPANSLYAALQLLGHYMTPFRARVLEPTDPARAAAYHALGGAVLAQAEWYRATHDPEKLRAKVRAWAVGGQKGYRTLLRLVECLREDVVAQGGALPLAVQRERLAAGALARSAPLTWARAVRLMLLLHVGTRFPARSENLGEFHLAWLIPERPDLIARRWDGAITIIVPSGAVKNKESLEIALCGPVARDADVSDGVPRFERDLLALYLMPGGARDILLTAAPGEAPCVSPYLFPSDARAGSDADDADHSWSARKAAGFPWRSVSTEFTRVVDRCGPRVGLNPATMPSGSKGLHIIRHLFASYFVPTNLEYASKMLGHADSHTTRTVYAWVEGLDFDYATEMGEASKRHDARHPVAARPAVEASIRPVANEIDRECPHCGGQRALLNNGQVARMCQTCRQDALAALAA